MSSSSFVPAERLQVAVAYLVDLLCALCVLGVAYWLRPSFVLLAVVAVELCVVDALARSVSGRTVGHWVSGTRLVADRSVDARPTLASSAVYSLAMLLLHVTVVGPLLVQLTASAGQSALHRVAKTRVVRPASESVAAAVLPSSPYGKSGASGVSSSASVSSFGVASDWQPQSDVPSLYPAAADSVQSEELFVGVSATAVSAVADVVSPQYNVSSPVAVDAGYGVVSGEGSFVVVCDDGRAVSVGECLVVGSAPEIVYPGSNTLSLVDDSGMIEAAHMTLTASDGQLSLLDLGSQAGATTLFPDGTIMHVPSGYELTLVPGCQIQLSSRLMTVTVS